MSTDSLLLLGASGQVGGTSNRLAKTTSFTSHYRIPPHSHALDSAIESLSSTTIMHGNFETPEGLTSLEALASSHSIVINAATSMKVPVNEAVLRGLKKYNIATGKNAILLHLSGSGNFSDNRTTGEFHATGEVAGLPLPFDDTDPAAVRKINAQHLPNGASDEVIMAFANKGKANVYLVCPTGIYGASSDHIGLLATTDEGRKYAKTPGVWAGWMIANIKAKGFSPQVGLGNNAFYTVHVDDVVSLTMLVYAKALRERDSRVVYGIDDVYDNFYLAAGNKHKGSDIAELFAKAAGKLGVAKSAIDVKVVTYEEAGLTARYLAGNMLIEGKNAQKLGWVPKEKGLAQMLLA